VQRSILNYLLILALVQGAAAMLLGIRPGPPARGWIFLLCALPWTALTGWISMRNAHLLYTIEGSRVSRLNLATRVTLLRVIAVPLLVVLILAREFPAAGFVFLGMALTDWLDGFLARRMGEVTQLGRIADPAIDALFCGVTCLALALVGLLPLWVFLLVLLRYAVLAGGAAGLRLLLGYLPVRATFAGRSFYLVQYGLLAAMLVMGRHSPWTRIAGSALGAVQVLVSAQLVGLGLSLYREARRTAGGAHGA